MTTIEIVLRFGSLIWCLLLLGYCTWSMVRMAKKNKELDAFNREIEVKSEEVFKRLVAILNGEDESDGLD